MKKIISLFQRNYNGNRLVRNEIVLGAEWVLAGEGIATRKFDGTCCMVRANKLYKRYDAKAGKNPPPGFEAAQEPDPVTGHWPGWLPVSDGPDDKWFRDGWTNTGDQERPKGKEVGLPDGTYELCGPKVQGNPEGFSVHVLVPHGAEVLDGIDRSFDAIKDYLGTHNIEGIVWHHPSGSMVKIKGKDFGFNRAK